MRKGPCHIWKDASGKEKEAAKADLAAGGRYDMHGTNKLGERPVDKYTEANGVAVKKKGKGGVDWYRYQQVILKDMLLSPVLSGPSRKDPPAVQN